MINKDGALRAWAQKYILVTLSFMGVMAMAYLVLISFYPIPEANVRIVDTTQGFLMGTVLNTVITIFTQFLVPKKEKTDESGDN